MPTKIDCRKEVKRSKSRVFKVEWPKRAEAGFGNYAVENECGHSAEDYSGDKNGDQDSHQKSRKTAAQRNRPRRGGYRSRREDYFSKKDPVAEDRVVRTELEEATEKIPCEQRNASLVRLQHREIRQYDERRHKKRIVASESILGVRISSTGGRKPVHEESVVSGDEEHDDSSDRQTKNTAQNTSRREVCAAHYEKKLPQPTLVQTENAHAEKGRM